MVFGEIIEPSTRALIDDDLEEYPDYEPPTFDWEGNTKVPAKISTLVIIEGDKLIKLGLATIYKNLQPILRLPSGNIAIYELGKPNSTYLVKYTPKDFTPEQLVEQLSEWIRKSERIFTLKSVSLSDFQCPNRLAQTDTLIRNISTKNGNSFGYRQLEMPNLITGIGSATFSYCLQSDLDCSSFNIYMDNCPLDSINTNPIIDLLQKINLKLDLGVLNFFSSPSNLYL